MTDLPKITLKDEKAWNDCVRANGDPYGAAGVRYAARWMNFMERDLVDGKGVAEVAASASKEADDEGITGFMHGCAAGIISAVWVHGEEFRRYHNLKTQIGNEGERANKSGGVLNPAVFTVSE